MKVRCPNCNTTYRIADERVPKDKPVVKVRCKSCGHIFDVASVMEASEGHAWFIAMGSEKKGPIEEPNVITMIRSGEIGPETYVWRKGFSEWVRLGDVAELAAHVPRARRSTAEAETQAEEEKTVVTALPFSAEAPSGAAEAKSEAVSAESGPAEAQAEAAAASEEEPPTKMIWQRRETSVLFSLEDYKTRRKTRATQALKVSPLTETGEARGPVGTAAAEVPVQRPKVIALEEVEVKRVAEALSRRQRKRILLRNIGIGVVGLAVVSGVVVYLLGRVEEPRELAVERPSQVEPKVISPEVKPQIEIPQQQPQLPQAPTEPQAQAPQPERKEPAPPGPKKQVTSQPPSQKGKVAPVERVASAQQPAQPPPKKQGEGASDDVNALLATLKSGQPSEQQAQKPEKPAQAATGETLPEQLAMGQIHSVLRRHHKDVEECVKKAGVAPGAQVTVSTRIEIEGSGSVVSASVSGAGAAEGCVRSVLMGLKFPRFRGPNMPVTYPFRVTP